MVDVIQVRVGEKTRAAQQAALQAADSADRAALESHLASQPFANTTELNAYTNAALALGDRVIIPGDGSYEVTDLDPLTWTRDVDSDGKRAEDAASAAAVSAAAAASAASPIFGSARFPDFNGQHAGQWGAISQATTNFGTWFGADGCFFVELEMPQERLHEPRRFLIFGNTTSFSGSNRIVLEYVANSFVADASLRREFRMYVAGASGVSVISEAIPITVQRVIVYAARVANSLTLKVLDVDTGTLYSGGAAVDVSTFTGIASFNGTAVQIGDSQTVVTERASFSNVISAWHGGIGKIGYTTDTVADADFEAIRTGTDPVTQFGASTMRWYRALDGSATSLAKLTAATGDTTSAAVAYGRVGRGGHISQNCNITLNRIPDGLVFAQRPGESFVRIPISGTCKTITVADVVEVRLVNEDGVIVVGWSQTARIAASATSWSGEITAPVWGEWLRVEVRLRSDRTKTHMGLGLFGLGAGCGVLGQSQIANGMGRSALGRTFDGQTPQSLCWTFTSQSLAQPVIWRLDRGKAISDMMMAAAEQASRVYGGAVMWIVDAVGGTSPDQLIDDSESVRLWTQFATLVSYAQAQLSTMLVPWFTNIDSMTRGGSPVTVDAQMNAFVRGKGTAAKDHYLFEAGVLPAGATVVVYPGSRHSLSSGTLTADGSTTTTGATRAAMRAWAAGKTNVLIGPEQIVTLVDQFHPGNTLEGDVWLGFSLGIGVGIGMRTYTFNEATVDVASFAWTDGTKAAFTFDIEAPLNRPIHNSLGARFDSGADKGVMGIEVSTDDGATWAYLPATAQQITGRFRVTVTKPSGAWGASIKVRFAFGGPFAWGTSNADGNTAAQKYWLYDGDLRCSNGFGNPVRVPTDVVTLS